MIETFEELPIIGEKIKAARAEGVRSTIIELLEDRFQSVDGVADLLNTIEDVSLLKKIVEKQFNGCF